MSSRPALAAPAPRRRLRADTVVCVECNAPVHDGNGRMGYVTCDQCNTDYKVQIDPSNHEYKIVSLASHIEETSHIPATSKVVRKVDIVKYDKPVLDKVCYFCSLPVYEITKVEGEIHWLRDQDGTIMVDPDGNKKPVRTMKKIIPDSRFVKGSTGYEFVEGRKEVYLPSPIKDVITCPGCSTKLDKVYDRKNTFVESYSKGSGKGKRTYFHSVTAEFGNSDRDVRSSRSGTSSDVSVKTDKNGNEIVTYRVKRLTKFRLERYNVKVAKG